MSYIPKKIKLPMPGMIHSWQEKDKTQKEAEAFLEARFEELYALREQIREWSSTTSALLQERGIRR